MNTATVEYNGTRYSVNPLGVTTLPLLHLIDVTSLPLDGEGEQSEEQIWLLLLLRIFGSGDTAIFRELNTLFPEFGRDYICQTPPLPGQAAGGYSFREGAELLMPLLLAKLLTNVKIGDQEIKSQKKEAPPVQKEATGFGLPPKKTPKRKPLVAAIPEIPSNKLVDTPLPEDKPTNSPELKEQHIVAPVDSFSKLNEYIQAHPGQAISPEVLKVLAQGDDFFEE